MHNTLNTEKHDDKLRIHLQSHSIGNKCIVVMHTTSGNMRIADDVIRLCNPSITESGIIRKN